MRIGIRALAVAVLVVSLGACRSGPGLDRTADVGIDGVACAGSLTLRIPGTVETTDVERLEEARGASGKGGLCAGQVLVVQEQIQVYRVWDSSRQSSSLGRWWSLTRPSGTREAYRKDYAICSSWSALDRLISCTLKPGAVIVIGNTQSASCDEGEIPKSSFVQIYVRNQLPDQLLVENCHDEGAWPAP